MEAKSLTTQDLADTDKTERADDAGAPATTDAAPDNPPEQSQPLLDAEQTETFSREWADVQTGFVDEPRQAVERADALVADVMQRLASSFSNERQGLESQWDRGEDVSTEDLRLALTRYRSFFHRLLSA
jgi:hypothetical protein